MTQVEYSGGGGSATTWRCRQLGGGTAATAAWWRHTARRRQRRGSNDSTLLWFAPQKTTRILGNFKKWLQWENESLVSIVRTHPHAHQQHMKIVKHRICVLHWCVSNLEWVYSLKLKYGTTLFSLLIIRQPEFKVISIDNFQNERDNCFVKTHPYARPRYCASLGGSLCDTSKM